jgi:succinate-semialdehyde dehydrogenase/glutarate-semialdehyde dehydrogenase
MSAASMPGSATSYPQDLALFIGGQWLRGGGRSERDIIDPASGEVIGQLPLATAADLDAALETSARAFESWRTISAWQRAAILRRAAQLITERKSALAAVLTMDNGKPLADALAEIDRVVETVQWCSEEATRTYGRTLAPRAPGLVQSTSKRPIGPVAAFAPWNFPAVLAVRKIAAALAAGCTVIVKPAEETPAVCVGLVRAFHDAGVPPGVLNLVFGVPSEVSQHLIASPVIRKVSFTGSVPVGRLLYTLASKGLKAITMELGGHSPVIVCADVDVQKVAADCAVFKYRNAGQVCLSPNRFFVHEAIHDAFVARFIEVAKNLKIGPGADAGVQMGPLNNARRLEAAERFLADARDGGAKVALGGKRIGARGFFFEPTVLTRLGDRAAIMSEEPFCPVAPIVPFAALDEAIAKANAVDFGLAAYAFTNASDKAAALSERLEAGWIGINSFTPALADAPLGGMKDSGVGYEGGPEGLDAYQQIRFLSHDRAYPSGR